MNCELGTSSKLAPAGRIRRANSFDKKRNGIIVLNCNVMSFEEEVVKSLDSTKELNSFQPMRDMVALARGKNISDKEIKSKLLSLFVKYYEEGENNNEESRDRADKIADLLDEMDYNRV